MLQLELMAVQKVQNNKIIEYLILFNKRGSKKRTSFVNNVNIHI